MQLDWSIDAHADASSRPAFPPDLRPTCVSIQLVSRISLLRAHGKMHQALDTGYPGLERAAQEQRDPNRGLRRASGRTPANSPLIGRQEKPGA